METVQQGKGKGRVSEQGPMAKSWRQLQLDRRMDAGRREFQSRKNGLDWLGTRWGSGHSPCLLMQQRYEVGTII